MAANEEFKGKIKAGEIFEALTLAMSEAIELEITTWVGKEGDTTSPDGSEPGKRMRTRMNLVEGTIENEVGSEFIGNGPYQELQEFHQTQVKLGMQMILDNLESLQKMFIVLSNTPWDLPQGQTLEKPGLFPADDK